MRRVWVKRKTATRPRQKYTTMLINRRCIDRLRDKGRETTVPFEVDLREPHDNPELLAEHLGCSLEFAKSL